MHEISCAMKVRPEGQTDKGTRDPTPVQTFVWGKRQQTVCLYKN